MKKKAIWLIYFILIIFLAFYVSTNYYRIMLIQGESMAPSYRNMQFVLLNMHEKNYSYGDVIAFECENVSTVLIKRIVALPGDVVRIEGKTLYVNGKVSDVFSETDLFEYAGVAEKNVLLGAEEYFVIGDNIVESKDSRYELIGLVQEKNIVGKVLD